MGRRSKEATRQPDRTQRFGFLLTRRWIIGLLVAGSLLAAGIAVYRTAAPVLRGLPRFQLTAERLDIQPPPPPWFRRDLAKETVTLGRLRGLNLQDRGALRAVWRALELHPWVRQVRYVSKRAGGRVRAEIVYRRPIAMVSAPEGWYPVDTEGVVLPSEDFGPNDPDRFLHILAPDPQPVGNVGTSFGRPGVVGACRIAALIEESIGPLGIKAIRVRQEEGTQDAYHFELLCANGSLIVWGRAPGNEDRGEASGRHKARRLRNLALTRPGTGTTRPPAWIDLRTGLTIRPLVRPASVP